MGSVRRHETPPAWRELTPGMRRLLIAAAVLVFLAGVQLFVFTERTDRYFAWTIQVPLTAAFLGAGYFASVLFEWLAVRERVWARARIAVPAVFVFTTLTLIATLLHLDLFHLDASLPASTRFVTLLWIAIYSFVPIAMVVLAARQARVEGGDPPHDRAFPPWLRAGVAAQAAVLLGLGAALFVAPEDAATLWPWPLTPLTARAIGAWLAGMGVAAAHAVSENDLRRARVASLSYAAFGVLQTIALARYPGTPDWDRPQAWVYAGFLASMVALGTYGARRAGARAATARTPAVTS